MLKRKLLFFLATLKSFVIRVFTGAVPLTISNALAGNANAYEISGASKQSRLPSGYTELEYITGDGNAYIDTGLTSYKSTYKYKIGIKRYSTSTKFVSFQNPDTASDNIGMFADSTGFRFQNGAGTRQTKVVDTTSFHDIIIESNGYTVDGVKSSITAVAEFTISDNLLLFTAQNGSTIDTRRSIDSIKYYIVEDNNGNTILNLVPAKNSSNVVGMFDLVTNTFFTNAGTGDFTAGSVAPTPTSPIEVVSCGDKTENLFDLSNMKYNGYTISSSTGQKNSGSNRSINVLGWLEAGDYIIASTTDTIGGYLHTYSEEGTDSSFSGWLGAISLGSATQSGSMYCKSFTLTQRCYCRAVNSALIANAGNVMLVKGSTAPTEYINFGYRIPLLKAENCGVVDLGSLTYNYSSTSNCFLCEISSKALSVSNQFIQDFTLGTAYNQLLDRQYCGNQTYSRVYFRLDKCNGNTTAFKEYMSGKYLYYQRATDTSWVAPTITTIYANAPLRKVGTYADVLNSNGTITRWIAKKVFDGTEDFVSSGILDNCWAYRSRLDSNTTFTDRTVWCTHFKHSATLPSGENRQGYALLGKVMNSGGSNPEGKYVGFGATTDYPTLAEWQAFLAEQYNNNNPVTIFYPLTTPTTEQITAPAITMSAGTNIIDTNTEVKASNVSMTVRCSQ